MKAFKPLAVIGFVAVGAWIGVELFRLNQTSLPPSVPSAPDVAVSVPPPGHEPSRSPEASVPQSQAVIVPAEVEPVLPPAVMPRVAPPVVTNAPPVAASLPGERFFDTGYGVTLQPPADWVMRNAGRWGKQETTLYMADPAHPGAVPSIYYKMYEEPLTLSPAEIEPFMRVQAEDKVKLRLQSLPDYTNRPDMITGTINGRPSLSWMADFTRNGQPWVEYLTRVYSPNGTLLYFIQAPATDLPGMKPALDAMIQTTVIP